MVGELLSVEHFKFSHLARSARSIAYLKWWELDVGVDVAVELVLCS
jgi:hypothetical protein